MAGRRQKKSGGRSYAWRYRGRIVACVFVEVIIICALVIMIGWNKGVKEWFARINAYGAAHGIRILHYINSSGMKEIIEGTQIAHEFRKIYACSFLYDVDGIAYWPAVAVNYTNKTQFIFKINKGVESVFDSKMVNRYIPENERPVPFKHMIYVGDGTTDIPCMRLVKNFGGHSIAVYNPAVSYTHLTLPTT